MSSFPNNERDGESGHELQWKGARSALVAFDAEAAAAELKRSIAVADSSWVLVMLRLERHERSPPAASVRLEKRFALGAATLRRVLAVAILRARGRAGAGTRRCLEAASSRLEPPWKIGHGSSVGCSC